MEKISANHTNENTEARDKIFESIGGWPDVMGDEWNGTNWSWQSAIKTLRNQGFNANYFLTFNFIGKSTKSSGKTIFVSLIIHILTSW